MVIGNIDHMIGIDSAKRCQAIAHDSKESDENVINDIDDIQLTPSDVDPACRRIVISSSHSRLIRL